jgi:hypothetical protein
MKGTLLILLIAFLIGQVNAQSSSPEVVSSGGENFQGPSIQVDWTLGELAITTIQNSSQLITQGFHQPHYVITRLNELPRHVGVIKVYPNPTSDRIEMKLNFDKTRDVIIRLYGMNGSEVWTKVCRGNQIQLVRDIRSLPNGIYFLNFLIDGSLFTQSFKIQKLN